MYTQCVLAFLTLYVGLAHCFSWDIVVGNQNELKFYNNGTLTRTELIPSAEIASIVYDAVHNRVLFSDSSKNSGIWSFDITTKKIQALVRCKADHYFKFAYDPVTETLFWISYGSISTLSLKLGDNVHGSTDKIKGKHLLKFDENLWGIAVDSCEGFIYWTTVKTIERARFDGSKREVLVKSIVDWRTDLAIDQNTQKMYWFDINNYSLSIKSADLNGKNENTLHTESTSETSATLALSKDFIYWRSSYVNKFWQLSKNRSNDGVVERKQFSSMPNSTSSGLYSIAANYKLEDQIQESRTCEALSSLLPNVVSQLCVHGTEVTGESACKCAQGYTGERCEVSVCQKYCFQGNCSVSDDQPNCRCNAGYSGKRCEVDACHKHCLNDGVCSLNAESQPVCQCTRDYEGDRCDVAVCRDYCVHGNCSVNSEGQPKCRCNDGYSGERCEDDACLRYCLNSGVCSMSEEKEPVCHCTGDYEGERCEVSLSTLFTKCFKVAPTLSSLRDILNTDVAPVTVDKGVLQLLSENNGACVVN